MVIITYVLCLLQAVFRNRGAELVQYLRNFSIFHILKFSIVVFVTVDDFSKSRRV